MPKIDEATAYKVRENKLRRRLERQGYRLMKSRRRDTQAYDFAGYMIVDEMNRAVAGVDPYAYSLTIDEAEKFADE